MAGVMWKQTVAVSETGCYGYLISGGDFFGKMIVSDCDN
jgi:hypothetical protein